MNVNKTKLSRSKYATPIDILNHAPQFAFAILEIHRHVIYMVVAFPVI